MNTEDLYKENEALENSNEAVAKALKKFNWGAFGLGWIWALFNGAYKEVIYPMCSIMVGCLLFPAFSLIGRLILIGLHIYFGAKGNVWAWDYRDWKSIDDFNKYQKKWTIAAIIWYLLLPFINYGISVCQYKILHFISRPVGDIEREKNFNSGAKLNKSVIKLITKDKRLKSNQKGDDTARIIVENKILKTNGNKVSLYNKNTIKISYFDNKAGKFLPKTLFSIYRTGNCSIAQENCYVISYTVKNGCAVFMAKTLFDNDGNTQLYIPRKK